MQPQPHDRQTDLLCDLDTDSGGQGTNLNYAHSIHQGPIKPPLCAWHWAGVPWGEDEGGTGVVPAHLRGKTDPTRLETSYVFLVCYQMKEESVQSRVGQGGAGGWVWVKMGVIGSGRRRSLRSHIQSFCIALTLESAIRILVHVGHLQN